MHVVAAIVIVVALATVAFAFDAAAVVNVVALATVVVIV